MCYLPAQELETEKLVLVTAFTIGHSLTLILSATDVLRVSSDWVEFLIPFTIIGSAAFSFRKRMSPPENLQVNYLIALGFGLIHGLGFANTIRLYVDGRRKSYCFAFSILIEGSTDIIGKFITHVKFRYTIFYKIEKGNTG